VEQFELAQSLAEKYQIPASQIAISFLTHILLDEQGSYEFFSHAEAQGLPKFISTQISP
jgi:hypothetical protein